MRTWWDCLPSSIWIQDTGWHQHLSSSSDHNTWQRCQGMAQWKSRHAKYRADRLTADDGQVFCWRRCCCCYGCFRRRRCCCRLFVVCKTQKHRNTFSSFWPVKQFRFRGGFQTFHLISRSTQYNAVPGNRSWGKLWRDDVILTTVPKECLSINIWLSAT